MSYQCNHCASLFFKTLETRYIGGSQSILYKKRCKRCKYKCLVRKDIANGTCQTASIEEWAAGQTVSLPSAGKPCERGRVFISEYALQVSRSADESARYLKRLNHAANQGSPHDPTQTNH